LTCGEHWWERLPIREGGCTYATTPIAGIRLRDSRDHRRGGLRK
jgi:hypothetical protein